MIGDYNYIGTIWNGLNIGNATTKKPFATPHTSYKSRTKINYHTLLVIQKWSQLNKMSFPT